MDLSGQSQEADSKSGSGDSAQQGGNLTDEDRIRLGAQQAALIHMLQIEDAEKQHIMVDEQRQRDLLDTQKEALAMQQAAMIESEKRQMLEQQQLQMLQAQALVETQKHEVDMQRMQQLALMERQKEEQEKLLQQQQQQQQQQPVQMTAPPSAIAELAPPPIPPAASAPSVPSLMSLSGPPQMTGPTVLVQSQIGGPPAMSQGGGAPPLMGQPISVPIQMGGPPPPLMSQPTGPVPLMGQQIAQPGQQMGQPRQQMAQPPQQPGPQSGPPQMGGQQPGLQQTGGPQSGSQQMGGPQSQQMGERPSAPQQMGGPPQQMGGPPQQMGGPPQQMGGPPQQMGGPPQQMSGPPQQMSGPPQQMSGPPQQMSGPPQQMGGPPQQMGGPPQQMGGPPQQMGGPPQHMDGQQQMGRPQQMGGPQQRGGPPQMGRPQQMGGPPQMGRPQQMGGPQQMNQSQQMGGPPIRPTGGPQGGPSMQQHRPQMNRGPPERPQQTGMGPRPDQSSTKPAEEVAKEIRLPQALERMLAFKDARVKEVGVKMEDLERLEKGEVLGAAEEEEMKTDEKEEEEADAEEEPEHEEEEKPKKKESKNKKKKKKKKRAKHRFQTKPDTDTPEEGSTEAVSTEDDVEIEYVQEQLNVDPMDPAYAEFAKIFQAFQIAEPEKEPGRKEEDRAEVKKADNTTKVRGIMDDDDDDDDEDQVEEEEKPKLSKKKMKKLSRLSVAELKQLVIRPDVVEMHDVTAQDPKLLVHLKATRNTVPVPRHWCFKRKYLQGKRGIEKPPFDLPDYIKATGIMEMREALQEKEDAKAMKAKMRERVRPKLGKIDIDYQKLHDAFFKWQTKPKLSIHGDLYYEGKEFETRLKEKKPGNLSEELRTALGMPIGANSEKYPPPWLIAMQRYGPPPSYPNLKVPGLNSQIPEGCSFGYHAGGWGKPPVDETGKPLYGDVFGTQTGDFQAPVLEPEVDVQLWGALESDSESEEESDEEEEEEEADATGLVTPGDAGLVTPSGLTSVPIGVETPDMIELRKKRIEDAMDQGGDTPALYTILPEKKTAVGAAMMGSAHVYDLSAVAAGKKVAEKGATEGIEVALNPEELDLDTAAMQAKYEQTVREQQSQLEKEDLSDMLAEHAAKQKQKRKKQQQDGGKASKKYKFKF